MAIPESIKQKANKIRNEVYGKDVREALASGIEEAGDIADQANTKSDDAVKQVDNIQAQVDQLVVEGDSSVEAAQARVDAEGNSYPTLKARLDAKETEFSSQLAQTESKINERLIDVRFPPPPLVGAKGDGITIDSDALENVQNYVNTNKLGKMLVPPGIYRLNRKFVVKGGTRIIGSGNSRYGTDIGTTFIADPDFADDVIIQIGVAGDNAVDRRSISIKDVNIRGRAGSNIKGVEIAPETYHLELENIDVEHCEVGFRFNRFWNLAAKNLTTNQCRTGFLFDGQDGGTSSTFDNCIAYNAEIGWDIQSRMQYSSINSCGTDGSDIGLRVISDADTFTINDFGVEGSRVGVQTNNPNTVLTLNNFSWAAPEEQPGIAVFDIIDVKQLNINDTYIRTNYTIFQVGSEVKKGAIRLSKSDIRTIDGRPMGTAENVAKVVDLDNIETYNNPVSTEVFEDIDVKKLKTSMRINRRMKIVLPVVINNAWASVRIISHGFSSPTSVETGGLITLSAYNNNGEIIHKYTNSNENNLVTPNIVGNTVEFIINWSHDTTGNFVICEMEGFSFREDIRVYRSGEF